MNILVTGSDGQLGKSIKQISNKYAYNFIFRNRKQLDITNTSQLEKTLS